MVILAISSLICVYYKGEFVVTQYSLFNGFPAGQGVVVYHFLASPDNPPKLTAGLAHVYEPTMAEWIEMMAEIDEWEADRVGVGLPQGLGALVPNGLVKLYPSLALETGAHVLNLVAEASAAHRMPLVQYLELANNSTCKWAYVVDLDAQVMEVFGPGGPKTNGHRFADVGGAEDAVPCFICSFTFDEVQRMEGKRDFIARIKAAVAKMLYDNGYSFRGRDKDDGKPDELNTLTTKRCGGDDKIAEMVVRRVENIKLDDGVRTDEVVEKDQSAKE